jgi:hypothetical protein
LQKLDPKALQQLKQDYAKRYGSDLDDDFLRRVDDKEKSSFETLLTPVSNDGRQFYFDALGRLQHSDSGYSPDGTLQTSERALQLYAEALQKFQLDGRNLSVADQAIDATTTGFKVVDDRTLKLTFDVHKPPQVAVVCTVHAQDRKKNVVGTLSVDIPAATERTTTHEVLIKTTTQAFAGLVHDCVRR